MQTRATVVIGNASAVQTRSASIGCRVTASESQKGKKMSLLQEKADRVPFRQHSEFLFAQSLASEDLHVSRGSSWGECHVPRYRPTAVVEASTKIPPPGNGKLPEKQFVLTRMLK